MDHTTTLSTSTKTLGLNSRFAAAVTPFLLGLIMLAGVGFVQGSGDVVHNAAHDTRHSISFPCH
jgi:cobalt transporter subunit CbtB